MQIPDRFFERVEARFGKRVETALLALIALGIAVFALSIIFKLGIMPITGVISDVLNSRNLDLDWREIVSMVLGSAMAGGISTVGFYITQRYLIYKYLEQAKIFAENVRNKNAEILDEFARERPDYREWMDSLNAFVERKSWWRKRRIKKAFDQYVMGRGLIIRLLREYESSKGESDDRSTAGGGTG